MREIDETTLGEILQTSGRCDQDMGALCPLRLGVERHAAVDGGHLETLGRHERLELCAHLSGELAGRDENECRRTGVGGCGSFDDRQGERKRLPGSGRRFCEHVEPCEGIRQDEGLDPERLVDGASGERVDNRGRHAKLAE